MPQVLTEHDHHGHGHDHGSHGDHGAHWTQIDIPEHYLAVEHGDHVDVGAYIPAHTAFIPYGTPVENPKGLPPTKKLPKGYHYIGIPTHYDRHNDHADIHHAYWALHEDH